MLCTWLVHCSRSAAFDELLPSELNGSSSSACNNEELLSRFFAEVAWEQTREGQRIKLLKLLEWIGERAQRLRNMKP